MKSWVFEFLWNDLYGFAINRAGSRYSVGLFFLVVQQRRTMTTWARGVHHVQSQSLDPTAAAAAALVKQWQRLLEPSACFLPIVIQWQFTKVGLRSDDRAVFSVQHKPAHSDKVYYLSSFSMCQNYQAHSVYVSHSIRLNMQELLVHYEHLEWTHYFQFATSWSIHCGSSSQISIHENVQSFVYCVCSLSNRRWQA